MGEKTRIFLFSALIGSNLHRHKTEEKWKNSNLYRKTCSLCLSTSSAVAKHILKCLDNPGLELHWEKGIASTFNHQTAFKILGFNC